MQPSSGTQNYDDCLHTQQCAQLEFVQVLVIVVVMMVMVVVITCLINHYRLYTHTHTIRRPLPLTSKGGLWSSECAGTSSGLNDHQVNSPRPPHRGVRPSYLQRDPQHPQAQSPPQCQRFQSPFAPSRFQPTYPFLSQSLIDLPPTIALSDGEEPPPYLGPCTLQLRDPEQQMELNWKSIRAPPNRTVFDSCPPDTPTSCVEASLQDSTSIYSGISVLKSQETLGGQQKQAPE